jgi:hypothetical protein
MRCLTYINAEAIDVSLRSPDADERTAAAELAELLTPISKGWSTDLGVELTSLAVQIHGGMGYIEETGVAQHLRDARIAPIYEGTNGIQAIDLVGRKLPMRGGGVMADFTRRMRGVDAELAGAGERFAPVRHNLTAALDVFERTTAWLLGRGLSDPVDALAGATPYLRMFGTVTGGYLLARAALAAQAQIDAGAADDGFLDARIVSARFFAEQVLPSVLGLEGPVTAGSGDLMALDVAALGA